MRTRAAHPAPRRTAGILRVAVGADHGGFELKRTLIPFLQGQGYEVADLGTHTPKPCDYPRIAHKVAGVVSQRQFDWGLLLCKSGIGMAIAANKVPGIRAAVCGDVFDATRGRSHTNANVLVIGAEKLSERQAARIVGAWCTTPFEAGGRHERRVRQIAAMERRAPASRRTRGERRSQRTERKDGRGSASR